MQLATSKSCARCGGPAEFSPPAQSLVCPFCRVPEPLAPVPRVAEVPLERIDYARAVVASTELRTATCTHCGASETLPAETAARRCAFCTHPLVLDAVTRVPAENVVPFRIDKAAAEAAFGRWIASRWFRPSDLRTAATLDHLRGVYVPSWIFHADARSEWRAESGYHYYDDETVVVDGKKETRRVQKTRWQPSSGDHAGHYRDVVVEASKGLTERELRSVEPFELTAAVGYQDAYLAGFEAECLSSTAAQAFTHAGTRIEAMERSACASLVPGDTHRSLDVRTRIGNVAAASALVPVYVAAYVYGEKVHRLLVNGQTAKVAGTAPWSWAKIVSLIVFVAVAIAAIVVAVQ